MQALARSLLRARAPVAVARRSLSSSHPDFAPIAKAAPAAAAAAAGVAERVRALIAAKPVVLFMKGSPAAPQCGFSAQVVRVLYSHGVEIHGEDVLSDAALRVGMKEFSKWPTFPQVRRTRRERGRRRPPRPTPRAPLINPFSPPPPLRCSSTSRASSWAAATS